MLLGKGFGILGLLAEVVVTCAWLGAAGNGLFHYLTDPPDKKPDLVVVFVLAAIGSCTAYCIYRRLQGVKEDRRFKDFLIVNAQRIRNGDAVFFRNERIYPNTELVRHHLVFSILILSFRTQTRWLIKGRESRAKQAWGASLYTLLYGWWGFPWGIYWTIVALVKNIKGSTTVLVSDLLQPAPPKPVGFNQRFNDRFSRRMRSGFFIDEKPAGILPAEAAASAQR